MRGKMLEEASHPKSMPALAEMQGQQGQGQMMDVHYHLAGQIAGSIVPWQVYWQCALDCADGLPEVPAALNAWLCHCVVPRLGPKHDVYCVVNNNYYHDMLKGGLA